MSQTLNGAAATEWNPSDASSRLELHAAIDLVDGISRQISAVDVLVGERLTERLRDCVYQILSAADELKLNLVAARGPARGGEGGL